MSRSYKHFPCWAYKMTDYKTYAKRKFRRHKMDEGQTNKSLKTYYRSELIDYWTTESFESFRTRINKIQNKYPSEAKLHWDWKKTYLAK